MTLRRNLFLPACLATLLGALLGTAAAGAALFLVPPEKVFTVRVAWLFHTKAPENVPPSDAGPPPAPEDVRAILESPDFLREALQDGWLRNSGLLDGAPDPLPRDWATGRVRVEPHPWNRGGFFLTAEGKDLEDLKRQVLKVSNAFGPYCIKAGLFTAGEGEGRWYTLLRHDDTLYVSGEDWSRPRAWAASLGLSVWALSGLLGLSLLARRRRRSLPVSLIDPQRPPAETSEGPPPPPAAREEDLQDFPPPQTESSGRRE
jgi:hypothetical protein